MRSYDPTRTKALRTRAERDVSRHIREAGEEALAWVERELEVESVFAPMEPLTVNVRFLPASITKIVGRFRDWVASKLPQPRAQRPMDEVVQEAYGKGVSGAEDHTLPEPIAPAGPALRPTPLLAARLKVLQESMDRHLQDLQQDTRKEIGQILEQGLLAGDSPKKIATNIRKKVSSISKVRAKRIARTEVIRAHAEGTLDRFESLGVTQVSANVEFSATKHADGSFEKRVCQKCRSLNGKVFKTEEAHGVVPVHPNCRCSWVPAAVVSRREKIRKTVARAALQEL